MPVVPIARCSFLTSVFLIEFCHQESNRSTVNKLQGPKNSSLGETKMDFLDGGMWKSITAAAPSLYFSFSFFPFWNQVNMKWQQSFSQPWVLETENNTSSALHCDADVVGRGCSLLQQSRVGPFESMECREKSMHPLIQWDCSGAIDYIKQQDRGHQETRTKGSEKKGVSPAAILHTYIWEMM